ncbi:MBL fold metallo-hydrolase [Edaphocola aurantiacus]|uniref:MBL fold metallo-hydrolase n=1 Tax=Edaphocola aurantiacus TaxID=2601682 RepID=UPI001C973F8E|nr:MBL fold metallo-hydrolase [Edaphocola aurantiacus]
MQTQIFPLSEGTFTVGRDKTFLPFDETKDELNDRSIGSILVEVQPFLIVNDRDVIICDAGLGFHNADGVAQLIANLAQHNIHPEDVTKVLMSHLHKDHAGGLPVILEEPAFAQAKIYVYFPEMTFAYEKGAPSYFTEDLDALKSSDRVVWLEESKGTIDGYIHYEHSGGHSPEHIVYWVDTAEGKIFFGGDEAPQARQMKIKYVAKYDYNGKLAMELRERWAEQGKTEGWQFLFYHDVKLPTVKL